MVMRLLHILLISCALAVATAEAQAPQAPVPQAPRAPVPAAPAVPAAPTFDMRNAQETRELLQSLFRQYPPSLAQVFRLDPSLLTNQAYLVPYPNLAAFLSQHPEVAHNPGYFIGNGNYFRDPRLESPEYRMAEMWQEVTRGILVFTVIFTLVGLLCWIVKTVIDHRRWLRITKTQSEVHSKLLDRFTSNQDLLAYVETPAGRRFLESAPISIDPGSRALSAPVGRILFSVQAGIVIALAGVGLLYVSQTLLVQDVAQPLFVVGTLELALGIGFVLSAFVAYLLSRQLGLLDKTPLTSASDGAGASPPHA